jgi:hypothetical protein
VLFHLGGAIADVDQDATAYSHRHAAHNLNINAVWLPNQPDQDEIAWSREFFSAVRPHQVGAYVNFLDRDDADRMPAAYGDDTYRRLVGLKDRHDPDNVFRVNHNIPPSTIGKPAGIPKPAGTRGGRPQMVCATLPSPKSWPASSGSRSGELGARTRVTRSW